MSPIQISTTYKSYQDLSRSSGFEMDFCQLEAGAPDLKTTTTMLSSVISVDFGFDKALHQKGKSPDGLLAFGLLGDDCRLRWAGQDIGAGHLIDFNSRSGFDLKSDSMFSANALLVEAERLLEQGEVLGVDITRLGAMEFALPRLVDPSSLQQLRGAIGEFKNQVASLQHQTAYQVDRFGMEEGIYRNLIQCLDLPHRTNSIPLMNRLKAVRRALEYIRAHSREVISISDLCRASSTTMRTLERGFRDEFGLTPKQYLNLVKLTGAHQDLCHPGSVKSIKDIALSWGFWHMSQFAQDYKTHFGELPTQTRNLACVA